ncbi:alpha beta-hydrolase [Sistotremastrum niveocremeum HHB9708]|uniref:Alpha beta-hydrolase n=2 Tax=Sistotremastraceae TaxID=3402574 RepID=A0A164VE75_9AGAM|nr:alpha beta-hydrolase [Sistotremastrum niveocremeum HHB9708]KZT32973.1 alpha/beta-hydrolase [Sistotremastrum suecicum HHB10207 ss-3]
MWTTILFSLLSVASVQATPVSPIAHQSRSVTTLSSSQISTYTPYAQFARAAYCNPLLTAGWFCGQACEANSDFIPYLVGGDGNIVQFFFVGYEPKTRSVVVAHQGTDPTQFLSLLTDVDILMTTLNPSLFPGMSSSIEVHAGFANEHALTASSILSTVKTIIKQKGATSVTLVGHSLGGALALLDAVFMKVNLPSNIAIKLVAFGLPRVGNPAFASWVDSHISDVTHINNVLDPIPIVPGRFLGFQHPHGEVHIVTDSALDWVSCPGDDDATDSQCTIASVPNILESDILDHLGPYNGVYIGTLSCT